MLINIKIINYQDLIMEIEKFLNKLKNKIYVSHPKRYDGRFNKWLTNFSKN